jgi:hypothetical protein
MGFNVTCTPGPNAAAVIVRVAERLPCLVIAPDPVNMTLHGEQSEAGARELAEFCRELAWEAARFAAEIDPDGEPIPEDLPARYLVVLGSSGGGC